MVQGLQVPQNVRYGTELGGAGWTYDSRPGRSSNGWMTSSRSRPNGSRSPLVAAAKASSTLWFRGMYTGLTRSIAHAVARRSGDWRDTTACQPTRPTRRSLPGRRREIARTRCFRAALTTVERELRGHDLACYCPLDEPCHADVLLAIANE
jgi:hypothetical protein